MRGSLYIIFLFLAGMLFGCAVGTSTNPTISAATSGICTTSAFNNCAIVLTYNTNSNTSLNISVTGNNYPQYFQLNTTQLQNCPIVNSNNVQTCTINITYMPTSNPISETLTFGLGTATSNSILISNN